MEKKVLVLEKELVGAKVQMLEMEKKAPGTSKTHIPEKEGISDSGWFPSKRRTLSRFGHVKWPLPATRDKQNRNKLKLNN